MTEEMRKNRVCLALEQAGIFPAVCDGALKYTVPESLGRGEILLLNVNRNFNVILGDYFLNSPIKSKCKIDARYIELSLIESRGTPVSRKKKELQEISMKLHCHIDKGSTASVYYPAGQHFQFVTIQICESYFLDYLNAHYPHVHCKHKSILRFLKSQVNLPQIYMIFGQISTCRAQDTARRKYMENKLQELLFYITGDFHERCSTCEGRNSCTSQDIMGLCNVESYLKNHMSESPSIEDLARMASMSPTKLKLLFKQRYGDTIYGYLRSLRMEHAAKMLKEEGLGVTEVAYSVGYKSLSRFSEAFFKVYGVLPSQYKS